MATIHPFDLQARAELAAQSLTALLDPQRDGLMYFLAEWRARPPHADHGLWDYGDGSGRHTDALTLARSMVRPDSPAAVPGPGDGQLEAWMLRCLGDEGLSWLPAEPWARPWGAEMLLAAWQPEQPAAEISWAQRATLMGLLSRFLSTHDERYMARAQRLIDALLHIAVRHPDGLFFPEGYYQPDGWGYREPGLFAGIEEYNAVLAGPALRWYQATRYEPALALAEGLVRFALRHTRGYSPDGTWSVAEKGLSDVAHLHTRTSFILAVLKLGLELDRRELVAWARQSYEHARTWGTTFGLFPEHLGNRHGEICGTVDMIELALLLGQHVDRRYYADAERYGRNQLLESQYLSLESLQRALLRLPSAEAPAPYGGAYSTQHGVAESQVGGFAARSTVNDAFHLDATAMMQCCNASGTRALYDLWRYAIEECAPVAEGLPQVSVHLRFSVETLALRIVSHEPAMGRLDITARREAEVKLRLPQTVSQALLVREGGQVSPLTAHDGYVSFDAAAGETSSVYYALPEREVYETIGAPGRQAACLGHWRGETLMRVEPEGTYLPLYVRTLDLPPVEPALPAGPMIESL